MLLDCARICAVVAVLVYPFQAAFHAATDEAHLTGAHHAGGGVPTLSTGEDQPHHRGRAHSHAPDGRTEHQFCDFCVLAGVTLLAAAERIVVPHGGHASVDLPSGGQCDGADDRLNLANPVRAPPRTV